MKRGPIALLLLTIVTGSAVAPSVATAGRNHGRPSGGHHHAVVGKRTFGHHQGGHRHHGGHARHHHRHHQPGFFLPFWGVGSVVYATPTPLYEAPPYYPPPPAYAPPPSNIYIPQAVSVAPAAPAPPVTGVVNYPTGQYELRGDGASVPYTWVWIPAAPPPPPTAPPADGVTSSEPSRARIGRLYRWLDADGVAHWTDRWDAVPEPHRPPTSSASPR